MTDSSILPGYGAGRSSADPEPPGSAERKAPNFELYYNAMFRGEVLVKMLHKSVGALALAAMVSTALAQQQPASTNGPQATGNNLPDDVIVTGTRRNDRTALESTAPIDILNGADLTTQSTANMLDSLASIVPSFIIGQNSLSDASSFVRSPSLRGLPGDEILVLLNGKRFNRSSLVQVYTGGETELSFGSQGSDLASIPSIAVRSLEILRDGASAQYGSDAIAGVLNYHFREDTGGLELTARTGKYFSHPWPSDGADTQIAANGGIALGQNGGFANLSVEWATNEQTVRNTTRPSALEFAAENPSLASQLPHWPEPVQEFGTPPSTSTKAVLNAGLPLANGDKIYFFANYAQIDSNESFNYRLPKATTNFSPNSSFQPAYLDACTSAYTGCPVGGFILDGNTYTASAMYPAGFTPRFYGTTKEIFGVVGYKGKMAGELSYDFSLSTGRNSLALSMKTSLNPSLGAATPKSFDDGSFKQSEYTGDLELAYPLKLSLLEAPVFLAGGLEWHHEKYEQTAGDPASHAVGPYAYQPLYTCNASNSCTPALDSSGAQIISTLSTGSNGYGGNSENLSSTTRNYAVYIDAETDLSKSVTVGAAVRYENYDTFGSTTLGKLQGRWKASDTVALRATASTGFHAPTAGQSSVEVITTGFSSAGTQYYQGTYPVTSAAAQFYGAKPIKPEKSKNFSAGVVFTPTANLVTTLDFYQIDVTDRIGISKSYTVSLADIQALPTLISVGVDGQVQYFTNGFDTRTRGVDLVLTHTLNFDGGGRLATTLAYNYNQSKVPNRNPDVVSNERVTDIERYAPLNRINLNLTYTAGKFTGSLREAYFGSFMDVSDYGYGQTFSAKTTTDLDLAYEVLPKVSFAVGSRNLFNVFPDRLINTADNTVYASTGSLGNGSVYPRTGGPFGFNGRFVYARIGAKF